MTAIHPLSSNALLSELDLFSVPPTQFSIERGFETEHRPISTLDAESEIDFHIPTSPDEYILLSESYLHVKLKLTLKKDAFTEADWAAVTPAQYLLHSLFKSCSVTVGNKQIVYTPQIYSYRAYLETLLGYSKDAKESHLSSALWCTEAERKKAIASASNTKEICLVGKLHTDLTFQDGAILGGLDIHIKLVPNTKAFYLKYPDTHDMRVGFTDASYYVYRIKATPELLTAHSKALAVASVKYPITRTEIKQVTIPSGGYDAMIDNIVLGQLPRRVFIACVTNDAFNGSKTKDPFNFNHFDINYLALFLDGTQYPAKAYQPNFGTDEYIREFYSLFQALDQNSTNSTISIDRFTYKSGFTIFGFNLTPDMSSGGGHLNPIKRGSMRAMIKFSKPLTEAISVLLFCEFDNLIEIDSGRTVQTDFN